MSVDRYAANAARKQTLNQRQQIARKAGIALSAGTPKKAPAKKPKAQPVHRPAPPKPAPVYRAPAPAPIRASSSGRYSPPAPVPSGARSGPIQQIKAPPKPPPISKFLGGDTGYQQQLRQLAKTLADFQADMTRRTGSLQTDTAESRRALEQQRETDLGSLEEDFGARGLIRSGLYAGAVGDYEKEFGQRQSDLERRLKDALAQLEQEQGQFGSQQKLEKQRAREQAIRRRAEKYNLS